MRYGEDVPRAPRPRRRSSASFCAGEVLNAPAWEWLQRTVFEDRVPVIDHMWQTETGGPIFGNPYGLGLLPIKPGSAGHPAARASTRTSSTRTASRCRAGREGDHAHPRGRSPA